MNREQAREAYLASLNLGAFDMAIQGASEDWDAGYDAALTVAAELAAALEEIAAKGDVDCDESAMIAQHALAAYRATQEAPAS